MARRSGTVHPATNQPPGNQPVPPATRSEQHHSPDPGCWSTAPDAMSWLLRHRSLVALSHAFEEAFAGSPVAPREERLLIGLFQRADRFAVEADRYARLAERSTVITGYMGPAVPCASVHHVPIDDDEALAGEWTLVGFGPGCAGALVATERLDPLCGDPGRAFEARWTFRRSGAAAEASRIPDLVGDRLPVCVLDEARRTVHEAATAPETFAERAQATIMESLLARIDDLTAVADAAAASR